MFMHVLENMLRQYRNIETDGSEAAAAEPVEQEAEQDNTEQPATVAAENPEPTSDGYPADTPDWVKRRMSQMSQQKREQAQENERLRAQITELQQAPKQATSEQLQNMGDEQLSQYVEALADQRARQMVQQQLSQQNQQTRWAKIEADGMAGHGDEFMASARRLADAGVSGEHFLSALQELDEAPDVIAYLGQHQNIDEAQRIIGLSPVQMGIELARLGPKAKAALKKQVSKAPVPPSPVGGNAAAAGAEPKTGTPEWFAWRNKQVAARRGG